MKTTDSNILSTTILSTALAWREQGRSVALASVVETWGSAPQPVGSQLLIDSEGNFLGSVSGGCVEGAVVTEAIDTIAEGTSKLLSYGVSNEMAWEVGLGCGGQIKVFVESIDDVKAEVLKQIVRYQRGRVACIRAINLMTGEERLFSTKAFDGEPLEPAFRNVISSGVSQLSDDGNWFLHLHDISLKLIIVGAVHIAQSLVPIAEMAGFDVAVIDPRESFASVERFGDVTLVAQWPDEALAGFDLDNRTALVALSHDPKIDDPALRVALESACFYIGALGSRKSHAARLERLSDVTGTERIDGPIGLDIGAKGANEIAFSIVSKLISVMRGL